MFYRGAVVLARDSSHVCMERAVSENRWNGGVMWSMMDSCYVRVA